MSDDDYDMMIKMAKEMKMKKMIVVGSIRRVCHGN